MFVRFYNSLVNWWLWNNYIVYVWSKNDGANIKQWTVGYGWRQNQEAKLKIVVAEPTIKKLIQPTAMAETILEH